MLDVLSDEMSKFVYPLDKRWACACKAVIVTTCAVERSWTNELELRVGDYD